VLSKDFAASVAAQSVQSAPVVNTSGQQTGSLINVTA
jgi:hypothetical protein